MVSFLINSYVMAVSAVPGVQSQHTRALRALMWSDYIVA